MKTHRNRYTSLLLALVLCFLPCAAALAKTNEPALPTFTAEDYVKLGELREQVTGGWHQTYAAKGREIEVKADIPWMPDADECPIVQVEGFGKGNTKEDLLEPFRKHNLLLDAVGESPVVLFAYDESIWAPGSYKGMRVTPQDLTFYRDETPTEQAENVDLTYEEFIDKVNHDIELLTGLTLDNFIIEKTTVQGPVYKAKEKNGEVVLGEAYLKCGSYAITGPQQFYGIPMVRAMYTTPDDMPEGYLTYSYSSSENFSILLGGSKEVAVHTPDVPLLSFDAIKSTIEGHIETGHLRGINGMKFGYLAAYQGSQNDRIWLLMPVWCVEGGYAKDPNTEKHIMPYHDPRDTDGSLTVPLAYGDYYFSAQTGELLNTSILSKKPAGIPVWDIITWEDVGGNR